ncbi:2-amino-4-hydroxy-6-hydroxymethyldihydropteridine diphosphokinase [Paenibacillus sp. 481]|uniref:2-amino-4-hydroxy-6- hydroxymethyldihydropteridine diphosphokinase n=1 Tax=Paenibacillus sp. 481 TaxID=2835869 RepID=UPI001E5BE5B7|nr:2-amino-4-hydroxy-6-hydroxymethyldihydropteridine diphosphokinase [Paenibacillus sp. 481]UHA75297.1 2-amino-4-hydroxy-6-hydroxymethyldihydropteridine diphosphokinase [Paenibacillus sp. 481]
MTQQWGSGQRLTSGTVEAYIALGANIGEREQTLYAALSKLSEHQEILIEQSSPLYETDPVGYEEQPAFLNMAVRVRTSLDPEALLRYMLDVELQLGRVREVRWGPRSIDLDLLWVEGCTMDTTMLTLPHPRIAERLFVLVPLADVISVEAQALDAFVQQALGTLEGKEGIRLWSPCKWPDGSALSAN